MALVGAVLALAVTSWAPAPAYGHALLTASTPGDGASVDRPPGEVMLTFNESPDPALARIRLLDASGSAVTVGDPERVPDQPAQLRVKVGPLDEGVYTVTWRVTSSADGHTTAGSVAFGVGVPAAAVGAEGASVVVELPSPTPGAVAGRWLFYVGGVLLLGAAVVGVAVVANPATVVRAPLIAAWVAAAGGLMLTINDQRAAARTSLGTLLSSSTGHKLTTQLGALALVGVAVVWACRRRTRRSLALVGVAAALTMLARALAGHANASSARWFTVGTQWVHLVAVGAWIGGLFWILVALRRGDPGQGRGLARRFSAVAGLTLAAVAVSGTLRAFDQVGAWDRLLDTSFGLALLVKLGLFAGLVALGARNRFRHVAGAAAGPTGGLRRLVRGEVAIAAGVLGATAVLASLPPASSLAEAARTGPESVLEVTGSDFATSLRVRLVATPGTVGPNRFVVTVEDYDSGEPVAARAVSLRFQLADRADVAPSTLELALDGDRQWRGSGSVLSIDGRWTAVALVQTPADAIEVPMEMVVAARAPTGPAPGSPCASGFPDPAYELAFNVDPAPPTAEGATFLLDVRRGGQPVRGATVCLKVDMPQHQHPGILSVAREGAPGRYEVKTTFPMTGAWRGSVVVAEQGKRNVALPISFDVV